RSLGQGGGDEVVTSAGQKRNLTAAIAQKLIGVAVAPVLLDAGAEPQVLDAHTARVDDRPQRACLGKSAQRPPESVEALLQVRSEMGDAQAEQLPARGGP